MSGRMPGLGSGGAAAVMTRRAVLRLVPPVVASLAGAACGYALAGRGNSVPEYIRIIGVPMFGNRTPYSPMEQVFTEKVRVEFQSRGGYQVSPNETGVDGLVRGELTGLSVAPVGFTGGNRASRYRFTISVSVSFADVRQQKTLWENPGLTFSDEYELATAAIESGNVSIFIDQERAAVDRLSTDFARSVVSAILEAF